VTSSHASIHDDRKLGALTGIRFFAAGAVLLSHYAQMGIIEVPDEVVRFLDGGRPAVALFFLLSGFILAFNYYDLRRGRKRAFWVARFARLYPNVLLALALALPSVIIALSDPSGDYLLRWFALDGQVALSLVLSFVAQLTMTTAWLPVASFNQPWNGPAWSIGCEVFFYALFPLLIGWVRAARPRTLIIVLVGGFIAQGALISGIHEFAPEGRANFLVSQFPVTHLFGFVLGVSAARLFLARRELLSQPVVRTALLAIGWVGVSIIGILQPVQPVFYLATPLFALIVLGLAAPAKQRSWLAVPLLVLLGEASYALYLIHVPIGHLLQWGGVGGAAGWIATGALIAASVLVLRIWETPARKLIRSKLTPERRRTP
jgi:peptidoglycan/LPS O-acetylase OafA/YrhL